jgi:hypothetical protein
MEIVMSFCETISTHRGESKVYARVVRGIPVKYYVHNGGSGASTERLFKNPGKTRSEMVKNEWYYLKGCRRCPICNVQMTWGNHETRQALEGKKLHSTNQYKRHATVEHLYPKSHGGTNARFNMIVVCYECNSTRKNMSWMKWMHKRKPILNVWLMGKFEEATKEYMKIIKTPEFPRALASHVTSSWGYIKEKKGERHDV